MPSLSIKINAKLFNALPIDEQNKITEIMKQTNLLDKEGSIVADPDAPDAEAQGFFDRFNPCKIGCDVAASAAAAACTASTAGAGLAVCLAAATAAHQACRDAC